MRRGRSLTLKWKIIAWIAPSIILVDQFTKLKIVDNFFHGESLVVIPGFFSLTYIHNTGAAFGMLSTLPSWIRVPFFLTIPIIALFVVFSVVKKLPARSVWMSTSLALVLGGALGNFVDRVRVGYVIDFLDFHYKNQWHFWIFNVADSGITVGVAMLLIDMFRNREKQNVS